jgi:chromosome segregation ATPase
MEAYFVRANSGLRATEATVSSLRKQHGDEAQTLQRQLAAAAQELESKVEELESLRSRAEATRVDKTGVEANIANLRARLQESCVFFMYCKMQDFSIS